MATDAADFEPGFTKRKKSFYAEEEEIVVKPSTELIPDEYEHFSNDSVLFHVFRTKEDEEYAQDLLECVQDIDYKVNSENNVHDLRTIREFSANLEAIKRSSVNKSALLLVFIGYFEQKNANATLLFSEEKDSIYIKEIWNTFSSHNCPELKDKPKVLLFCTSPKPRPQLQTDSMSHHAMDYDKVYDFPAESDILIIYKKVEDAFSQQKEIFLGELCYNVKHFSKKYDIIDLVSYIHTNNKSAPLIISTLTRKFYLTPNTEREHYLTVVENHNQLEDILQKIQNDIAKLQEATKKKKEKNKFFSFRRKTEDKPKVIKRTETSAVVTDQRKISKPKDVLPVSSSGRLSVNSATGRRSRQVSESDSSAVTAVKPKWKI